MKNIKILKKTLKITLIVSTVIFPLFFNVLGGAGLVYESVNNYSKGLLTVSDFSSLRNSGVFLLLSSFFMLTATALCIKKKDIMSIILETSGFIIFITVFFLLINTVKKSGLSDENLKPYSQIYFQRHFPTVIHFPVVFALSLMDYFSYDNILQRKNKENKEYADESKK